MPLDEWAEGELLARPVFSGTGHVLLEEGTVLTAEHIEALRRWGIVTIEVVDDPAEADDPTAAGWDRTAADAFVHAIPPEEIEARAEERIKKHPPIRRIPDLTHTPYEPRAARRARRDAADLRRAGIAVAAATIDSIARRAAPRVPGLKDFIRRLVDSHLSNRLTLPALAALRDYDDVLVDQAVKTTVYALLIGVGLGMEPDELYCLGECAILHDVGMARVPPHVWTKEGPLSIGERLDVQKHVIYGADLLSAVRGICPFADLVAYQHHERHDGSGYPKGRHGPQIVEYARIVGLADAYAGMTGPRKHRERLHGYAAMSGLLFEADRLFDGRVYRAFLSQMGLYPIGSTVEISTGDAGRVVVSHPLRPYRPVVRILRRADGRRPPVEETVDLSVYEAAWIVRPLSLEAA